jgi:hypothetical protein
LHALLLSVDVGIADGDFVADFTEQAFQSTTEGVPEARSKRGALQLPVARPNERQTLTQ